MMNEHFRLFAFFAVASISVSAVGVTIFDTEPKAKQIELAKTDS